MMLPNKLARGTVSDPLPQDVVKGHPTATLLETSDRGRQINVDEVQVRKRLGFPAGIDRLLAVGASDHPDLVPGAHHLSSPIPSDSRLRTLTRFAGISRKKYAHQRTTSLVAPRRRAVRAAVTSRIAEVTSATTSPSGWAASTMTAFLSDPAIFRYASRCCALCVSDTSCLRDCRTSAGASRMM